MKLAFIDLEFGQIYGSWRRDFLITEAAVLRYNGYENKITFSERHFKSPCHLVMRKRMNPLDKHHEIVEFLIYGKDEKKCDYDPKFKRKKRESKSMRYIWKHRHNKELKKFIKTQTYDADAVVLFGGREDINLLSFQEITFNIPILDIQKIIQQIYGRLCSLDKVSYRLNLELNSQSIHSINHHYALPKSSHIHKYKKMHLQAHHAIGDTALMFLAYKELIELALMQY